MDNVATICRAPAPARLAAVAIALGWLLPASAQQAPKALFKAETALMEIEVRVTDRRGQPVAGLSKDDFELLENGRPESIATFEFVTRQIPTQRTGDPPVADESPRATALGSASDFKRSTFIYIATRGRREDRPHIYREVKGFVDENLVPGVLVSLEGSPFTSRRSELYERLEEMQSRGSGGLGGFVDTIAVDLSRDIEYSSAYEALIDEANEEFAEEVEEIADRAAFYRRLRMYEYIDLIRALSIYPGRKLVVLFATGLPVDEDNLDVMKVLEDEATKARVRFYVADVGRLTATSPFGDAESSQGPADLIIDPTNSPFTAQMEQRQDNQDGLWELAHRTGGRAVLNSNDFGEVFDVVNRESGDYYLLGYYPSNTEQQGRLRRLRVRVNDKRLRVSYQRGYYEERPFKRMSRSEKNLRMHQALLFDTPYTDLPIRVDHEFFRDTTGTPTLVYSVGLHSRDIPSETVRQGEVVKLTVIARASRNRAEDERPEAPVIDEQHFEMTVDAAVLERLSDDPHSWLHYSSQMPLAAGVYDWKVVVRDDLSGSLGSFQTALRVAADQGWGGASSLLLTGRIDDVSEQKRGKRGKGLAEDVLTVDGSRFFATAVKSFRRGDSIYLLYDIYNPNAATLAEPPAPVLALYRGKDPVQLLPVTGFQAVAEPDANRVRYLAALASNELIVGEYTLGAMLPPADGKRPVIYRTFNIVDSAAE